jgi:uncharacterized membrane protein YeaQ/YmgE (transglycosylase-associated protein family)
LDNEQAHDAPITHSTGPEREASGTTARVLGPSHTGGTVTVTGIITAIVIGAIIGALGRLVVPGKQHIPIWLTIVVGIIAAFIGTFIARAIGIPTATSGIDWLELLVQVIVAAIGVVLVANLYGRRSVRH